MQFGEDTRLRIFYYVGDTSGDFDDVSLSYFEFTTLAILHVMTESKLDVAILEVGLGGRLDAVNIIDADCAIICTLDSTTCITSIG